MKIFNLPLMALLTFVGFTIFSTTTWASPTKYIYTGNNYDLIGDNIPDGITYTTDDFVSGQLTLPAPLGPNLDLESVTPTSFSFYDGRNRINNFNVFTTAFLFSTDDSGQIIEWHIFVYAPVLAIDNQAASIQSTAGENIGYADDVKTRQCTELLPDGQCVLPVVTDYAQARNNPGSWTAVPVTAIEVDIDIRPKNTKNNVNVGSTGLLPVAILTAGEFDALRVNPDAVQFGPAGATEVHSFDHVKDVDNDGDMDVLLHFRIPETGIQCGDPVATLTGETWDGTEITGTDSINTIRCN